MDPSHVADSLLKAALPKGQTAPGVVHLIIFYINTKIVTDVDSHVTLLV